MAPLDELATPELAAVMSEHITAMRAAFPDVRYEIDDVIAEGDRVVVRWTRVGTHLGPFRGIAPTGRRVTHSGVRIWRFAGGRAVDMWGVEDVHGLLGQVTAAP